MIGSTRLLDVLEGKNPQNIELQRQDKTNRNPVETDK